MMNRNWVRWGILSLLAVALTFGQYEAPFKPYDPLSAVRPPSVRAQQPAPTEAPDPLDPVPTLTPTPPAERAVEPSGEPTATLSPLSETSTPLPSDTATKYPTETATQGALVTSTFTPMPTSDTPVESPPAEAEIEDLPALTESVSPPGTTVEKQIGREGGTISSPDGRVSVVFPAEAVAEDLAVRITRISTSKLPPNPSQPLLIAWQFEAFSVNKGTKVEQFPADLEIVSHFSAEDTIGRNPATLKLWYLNENGEWAEVPSSQVDQKNAPKNVQRARTNHFSIYGEGADSAVQLAPFLVSAGTNLSTGTAISSIPIDLPSAPGGLVPSLGLTYDSGRVDAMRNNDTSIGSWVGIGWDMAIGGIRYEPPAEVGGEEHYYLEMPGGGGGEIVEVDEVNGEWRLKDESFLRISKTTVGGLDQWTVEDKSAKIYVFGGTDNTSRYYWYDVDEDEWDEQWVKRYYQWDIDYIEDVHGNTINYEWEQVIQKNLADYSDPDDYVRSSYVSQIIYGDLDGGHVRVEFALRYDEEIPYPSYPSLDTLTVRYDTYVYNGFVSPLNPVVTETRRLNSISVYVVPEAWQSNEQNGDLARKYDFSYETTPWEGIYFTGQSSYRKAGTHLLTSVSLRDSEDSQTLYTSQYSYATYRFGWRTGEQCSLGTSFERPYLVAANNGFGGIASFSYGETPNPATNCGDGLWSRNSVVQTNMHPGGDQPDMATNLEYTDDSGDPSGPFYNGSDPDDAELLGYGEVTEREGRTVTLRPDGPGNYSQWQYQEGSGSHWQLVSDDIDTTSIRSQTVAQKDSYSFTDTGISSGTIYGITLRWQWREYGNDPTYSPKVEPFVRIKNIDNTYTDHLLGSRKTEKTSYSESAVFVAKNPATGNAWTISELNNLEAGLRVSQAPTANASPVVTHMAVDVIYSDPNTASYTKHYLHLDARNGREFETDVYGRDGSRWSKTINDWGFTRYDDRVLTSTGKVASEGMYPGDTIITIANTEPAFTFKRGQIIRVHGENMFVMDVISPSSLKVRRFANDSPFYQPYIDPGSPIQIVEDEPCYFSGLVGTENYPNKDDDDTSIVTNYIYDTATGALTRVAKWGMYEESQYHYTDTAYHVTTSPHYIVAPKWTKVYLHLDPNNILSLTNYYYDGATSVDTAPTLGELTAVSKQVTDEPTYTTTYTAYDSYGNVTEQSSSRDGLPSGSGIPTDVANMVTTYDSTYHTYPVQVDVISPGEDPAMQTTSYEYIHDGDNEGYVFGVATTIKEPTGRQVEIRYDTFGRPTKVWDNFDSESYPTKEFSYDWDAEQDYKSTTTLQRTEEGSPYGMKDTVCYDGFGRGVQKRHAYTDTSDTVQAIKFDSRGLKEWEANYGDASGCADFDESAPRTEYAYDPLGRVTTVTNPDDTTSTVDTSTLTAVAIDENDHKKTSLVNGFGRVMQVEEYAGTGSMQDPYDPYVPYATTTYEYDRLGNITSVIDNEANESTMDYDMLGRKTAMDDMDMGAWSYVYDAAGNITDQTDARGYTTTMQYDALSRLTLKNASKYAVGVHVVLRRVASGSAAVYVIVHTNGQDYTCGTVSPPYGSYSYNDVSCSMGLTNPATGKGWTLDEINELQVALRVYSGDPRVTQVYVAVTDYTHGAQGQSLRPDADVGDPQSSGWQKNGGSDYYSRVNESGLNGDGDTTYIESSTANATISFEIDDFDANSSNSAIYTYDAYDNSEWCPEPLGQPEEYTTAAGKLTKMEDPSGTTDWCYDIRGRVAKERKVIDSVTYDVETTYDSANRPVDITYPDGEVVHQTYDDDYNNELWGHIDGQLYEVDSSYNDSYFNIWSYTQDYLAVHELGLSTSGTGVYIHYDYDDRGRLTNIDTPYSSALPDMDYLYDGVGNVDTQTIVDSAGTEKNRFSYDSLDRIVGVAPVQGYSGYTAGYAYSTNGRMTTKSEATSYTLAYDETAPDHPHAVIGAGGNTMTYDANGNIQGMSGTPTEVFTYDPENRLTAHQIVNGCSSVTTNYIYDGQGNLVKKMASDGTTIYIGGIYEENSDGSYVTYYGGLGRRIAMRAHASSQDQYGTLYFFLADHLGSTSMLLDASGAIATINGIQQSQKYYPFGSVRQETLKSITVTDKQFTGQQNESGGFFGLYNYGARFYSTTLGRFISADPVGVKLNNPQSFDRYSYVLNNPLRYIDPTGFEPGTPGPVPTPPPPGPTPTPTPAPAPPQLTLEEAATLTAWYNYLTSVMNMTGDESFHFMGRIAYWVDIYMDHVNEFPDLFRADKLDEYLTLILMYSPQSVYAPSYMERLSIPLGVVGQDMPGGTNWQPPQIHEGNVPPACDIDECASEAQRAWYFGIGKVADTARSEVYDLTVNELSILPWTNLQFAILRYQFPEELGYLPPILPPIYD